MTWLLTCVGCVRVRVPAQERSTRGGAAANAVAAARPQLLLAFGGASYTQLVFVNAGGEAAAAAGAGRAS